MKLFLKNILVFFILIALLLCLVEYSIRQLQNSFKTKTEYLKTNANTVKTIVLGSSHTYYGVSPKFLESRTFNASNISQSPNIDLAILKTYENAFDSLSTVVIRLSYDTLFEQLKDSPADWRLKDYKLYTDIQLDYNFTHNSEILAVGTRQVLKVLKDYYIKNKPILNCDSLGWGNDLSLRPIVNLEKVGLSVAKRHTIKSWNLLEHNVKMFQEINAWCLSRNIRVILVTPPAYKSYSENLNINQLNEMIAVGKYLEKKYSNCTYYNFMSHSDFVNTDFYDPDHLNAKGAKKFSLIINSIIEN